VTGFQQVFHQSGLIQQLVAHFPVPEQPEERGLFLSPPAQGQHDKFQVILIQLFSGIGSDHGFITYLTSNCEYPFALDPQGASANRMIANLKRLTRHSMVYGLGHVAARSIGFLLLPLHTNYLAENLYGVASLLFAYLAVMTILYGFGVDSAFLRYYVLAASETEKRDTFSTAFWAVLMTGIIFSAVVFVWAAPLSAILLDNSGHAALLRLCTGILFLDALAVLSFLLLRAEERSLIFAIQKFANVAVNLLLNYLFIVTFNRGTAAGRGRTVIGSDNLFMAYAHVAHDCVVGDHTIFANAASLAGHVEVGDYAILGGFTSVHQFTRLGERAFMGLGSVVTQDVPPYSTAAGNRARAIAINKEGLRRNGFSPELIRALHKSFRLLLKSKTPRAEAVEQLRPLAEQYPEVAYFIDFIVNSQRGIAS